jgi:hypothetical protein
MGRHEDVRHAATRLPEAHVGEGEAAGPVGDGTAGVGDAAGVGLTGGVGLTAGEGETCGLGVTTGDGDGEASGLVVTIGEGVGAGVAVSMPPRPKSRP